MNSSNKVAHDGCLFIVHRGLSSLEFENTCPSFVLACSRSYFCIETDVHLTKDRKFIICHNDNIERFSGISKVIGETNFDELRSVKLRDSDGNFRSDYIIHSIKEMPFSFIDTCGGKIC
jgi:glycerophosphoryl diester phosphodiesterase